MAKKVQNQSDILLRDAYLHYAPKTLQQRLKKAANTPFVLPVQNNAEDAVSQVKNLIEISGSAFRHAVRCNPIYSQMKENLAKRIASGILNAFGIRTKPTVGIERELISSYLFNNPTRIEWDTDCFETAGQRFESIVVRELDANQTTQTQLKSPAIRRPKLQRGRPSKHQLILEIIDELESHGVNLNSIQRKVAQEKILEYAKSKKRENTDFGFSNPVIQRALFERFGHRK